MTLFSGLCAAPWLSSMSVSRTRLTGVSGVLGVGLGSGFMPWGVMAGEESFVGQQNSPWLLQNDIGKMIYAGTRRLAQRQRQSAAEPMSVIPTVRQARSPLPRTQSGPTWRRLVRHQVHIVTGDTTNRESDELPPM
jgi:hypothetical protein